MAVGVRTAAKWFVFVAELSNAAHFSYHFVDVVYCLSHVGMVRHDETQGETTTSRSFTQHYSRRRSATSRSSTALGSGKKARRERGSDLSFQKVQINRHQVVCEP